MLIFNLMSKKLKSYLKKIGVTGVKALAKKIKVNWLYLYQIANGTRKASAKLAIRLHRATNGEIDYRDTLEEWEETWPPDIFIYHDTWKQKND